VILLKKIEEFLLKKNFTLIHLETVESTMIEIKKYIGDNNICMVADQQTAGIGRRGNEWISPKGNIYLSFLFKYDLLIEDHFLYSAITANSIVNFLKKYINEKINIKWPNDININQSKIAGTMTEILEKKDKKYIIIGTGINLSKSPKFLDYPTCSLNDYKIYIEYEDMLFNMIKSFFEEYKMIEEKKYNEILEKFKKKMSYLSSNINILLPNGDIQNVFLKNLNYDGSLLVEKKGEEQNIFSARIVNDIN